MPRAVRVETPEGVFTGEQADDGAIAGLGIVTEEQVRASSGLAAPDNPAKFSPRIIEHVVVELGRFHPNVLKVLDPFAGVGGVHALREHGYTTWGVEIEREWARTSDFTRLGNACHLDRIPRIVAEAPFDAIVTSPTYANRMADHHNAQDNCQRCSGSGMIGIPGNVEHPVRECDACRGSGLSRRHTYRHMLGHDLHTENTGGMQWAEPYRALHRAAWIQAVDRLRPGGVFVLNIKDHVRAGRLQGVPGWHVRTLQDLGLRVDNVIPVATAGMRHGANATARADAELLITFIKPTTPEPPF